MALSTGKFATLVGLFLAIASASSAPAETLRADLDPLIHLPGAYDLGPDDLEAAFPKGDWNHNPYFQWLDEERTRAIFQRKETTDITVELSLLEGEVPIQEAVVDFQDGKFLGVTISIFNRGDGGSISAGEFQERFEAMGRHLGKQLDIRPRRREAEPTQGLLTSGWIWISARGKAVLEHNPEAPGNTEFLRMRLARREAGGAYDAATRARARASVTLSDLPENVTRNEDGDIYIEDIPMVDQGAKGYCVVAAAQRLFEYYGIPCDMHQLAQIAGSDPDAGTSPLAINRELGAIDHLFKTRFECLAMRHTTGLVELEDERRVGDPVPEDDFHEMIRDSIDEGIPLLWGLELGRFPEKPSLQSLTGGGQVVGAHMRMIIGYNEQKDRIIFSDSWGAGHDFKTMDANDAYRATLGLFLLQPTVQ